MEDSSNHGNYHIQLKINLFIEEPTIHPSIF